MSKVCKITGKRPRVANHVSKANNKTKRRQLPNLQSKRIFVPELGKNVRIKLSVKALKTIDKYGLFWLPLEKNFLRSLYCSYPF